MDIEARKLRIIEAFASLNDLGKISQIESLLSSKEAEPAVKQHMLKELSGAWSDEEAEDMKNVIEEGCEKIDNDEW